MKPEKIVYIISDINKALAFEWIASGIDKQKFELHFLLLNEGESALETFLKEYSIPVQTIRCAGKKDWPFAWIKVLAYLVKHRPAVVHCHLLQANIIGLSAAKVAGVAKRIYTRHHSDYHFRYFPKGVKWDKLSNKLSTKIVAPSGAVRQILIEREKVPQDKIALIHHGFDLSYFQHVPDEVKDELRNKYNPDKQSPVVGVISRFTELKGIQYIIPAFKKLLQDYPDALLLLFNAKGDYYNELDALLSNTLPEQNYRKIIFENELAAVYALFDIFVQVSTDTTIEAFGQTYIEALAAKVPSVFTLAGIAPDFIKDKKNALVVPFKDADAVYIAMKQLLTDKDLSKHLTEKGSVDVLELFSLGKMITGLESLYK